MRLGRLSFLDDAIDEVGGEGAFHVAKIFSPGRGARMQLSIDTSDLRLERTQSRLLEMLIVQKEQASGMGSGDKSLC